MAGRNGDCFDHDTLFGHMPSESNVEHACLKDYLLEPSAHDKIGCDGICYPTTKTSFATSLSSYGCDNSDMINVPVHNNLHTSSYLDMHNSINTFLPNFDIVNSPVTMPNHAGIIHNYNNNNLTSCNDFPAIDSNIPPIFNHVSAPAVNPSAIMADGEPLIQQSLNDSNLLVNSTALEATALLAQNNSFSTSIVLDTTLVNQAVNADAIGYDIVGNNNFMASPLFSTESALPISKMDSDPFSPSISSSVSSIPSVEMPDKSCYVPGSVDSGVVVNGSSSSPFSTSDSNRNGECLSINDSLISPLTQGTGSERSVETTPGSESISSEMCCSPRVDLEMLSLELSTKNNVKLKEKSHKGRKRKNDAKKEKVTKTKKQPVIMPTYQSSISPGQNGIKLKISLATPGPIPVNKKRRKHKKHVQSESEPAVQSEWGDKLPEHILRNIFRFATETEGCLPLLVRMSQVCRLWRNVALSRDLWYNIDLSNRWFSKNPVINDYNFTWLCDNRLTKVQELNLGGWTFLNVPFIMEKIAKSCSELSGIGLSGWENLNADNVKYLVSHCCNLQRINLSGVSSNQSSYNKSGVALSSLLFTTEELGERLTQLVLSDNKLVGIPQLITALATHCPNLEVLDLSNVRTLTATGHIHVEKLHAGCQKLRILRITNSQVSLTPIPLKEQMASPGFPHLEELSVACMMNSLSSLTQPFIDDEAIERILKTSTKLKLLDVRNCSKVTDSSLVRVPAWDLTHLYLSGSYVTRVNDSGLELIAQKWSHSLIDVDFAWSTVTKSLDAAVESLAEEDDSPLKILDLTGSSVNLPPVQAVLKRCPRLSSLNLSSCRALPRGMKRLYIGDSLTKLKLSLNKPANNASSTANPAKELSDENCNK